MKKQILSFLSIFSLITGVMALNAQPWAWKAYKKTLPDGKEQVIFVEFDLHVRTHYTHAQKKDFIESVKKFGDKTLVLVEDFASYDGSNAAFKSQSNYRYFWEIYHNFLMGLTKQCRENGIEAQSIEFRHPMEISTDINELDYKTYLFFVLHGQFFNLRTISNYRPSIENWQDNFNETKKDVLRPIAIQNVDDAHSQLLQKVIVEKAQISQENQKHLDTVVRNFQTQPQRFANLLYKKDYKDEDLTFLKDLELPYIELRALKRIAENTDKHAIFICMGGEHSENLCTMLQETGYENIGEVAIRGTTHSMIQEHKKPKEEFIQVIMRHDELVQRNQLNLSLLTNKCCPMPNPSLSSAIIKQPNFWISPDTIEKCIIGSSIAGYAFVQVGILALVYKMHKGSLIRR